MEGTDNSDVRDKYRQIKEISFNYDLEQEIMVGKDNNEFSELVDSIMEKLCCEPWFVIVKMKRDVIVNVMEALEAVKSEIDGMILIFKMLTDGKVEHVTDSEVEMARVFNENEVIYMEIVMVNDNSSNNVKETEKDEKIEVYKPHQETFNDDKAYKEYRPKRAQHTYENRQPQQKQHFDHEKPEIPSDNHTKPQYRPRIKDLMENDQLRQQIEQQDRRPRQYSKPDDRKNSNSGPYERKPKFSQNTPEPEFKQMSHYDNPKPQYPTINHENNDNSPKELNNQFKKHQEPEQKVPNTHNPYNKPYTHYGSYKNATQEIQQNYNNIVNNKFDKREDDNGFRDRGHEKVDKEFGQVREVKQHRQRIMKN